MELSEVKNIIQNPELLENTALEDLSLLVEKYPYCQTLHLIYQKRLQLEGDNNLYQSCLARTACYASDAGILFYWLTEISNAKKVLDTWTSENIEASLEQENSEGGTAALISESSIGGHAFAGDHTFGYWLKLAISREINESETDISESEKNANQSKIIEEFLQKNPSLGSPKKELPKEKNVNLAEQSSHENNSLMTETLAQIYLDQGLYNKAIKAYEILSLKNPQKSSFFAQRIAQIKELKK